RLPLTVGRVTFIRRVSGAGTVTVRSQVFRVGKRHRGLYLRLVVDTGRAWLTAYLNGRVLKRGPYKLRNDEPTPNHAAAGGCGRHASWRSGGGRMMRQARRCAVGSQLPEQRRPGSPVADAGASGTHALAGGRLLLAGEARSGPGRL